MMGTAASDGDLRKSSRLAALKAGLHYSSDDGPGITRRRSGKAFVYLNAAGKRVADKKILARIAALAIPPAWTQVWISPDANAHLAATGRDAKGRKQYRYHKEFAAVRDAAKFTHLTDFADALPGLRKRLAADLRRAGLPREKVLAAVVSLLEETHIRIGNEDYAKANGSYGLSTLHNNHVCIKGEDMLFTFRGKSGKDWRISLHDPKIARIVRTCQELPGQHLFEYRDANGAIHKVTSHDVNDYLRAISGRDITAKDFRTWTGTVAAALAFNELAATHTLPSKAAVKQVIAGVAEQLGNTIAVCRKCYIHPAVIDAFTAEKLGIKVAKSRGRRADLAPAERAVLAFLKKSKPRTFADLAGS